MSFSVAWRVLLAFAVFGMTGVAYADTPSSETLVPQTTQYWISIPKFDEAVKAWNETELGKLFDDPIMKPFRDDLQRQSNQRRDELGNSLGIDWDDIKSMTGGELCLAFIHPAGRLPTRNMVMDVKGREKQQAAARAKLHATQKKNGAVQSTHVVAGVTITIFKKGGKTRVAEFLHGDLFCVARDEVVAADILNRALKPSKDHLGAFAPFVMTERRVAADTALIGDTGKPHVRWFVQPVSYAEARRKLEPPKDDDELDMLAVVKESGLDGVTGVGGVSRIHEGAYDLLHRAAVYAPKPWERPAEKAMKDEKEKKDAKNSMNMLSFVNDKDVKLTAEGEFWVPKQLASFSVGNIELLKAFDHFGPFFDHATAGGKEGAWDKAIKSIKTDSLGPKVDIREEIIKRFLKIGAGGLDTARCILITDNRLPVVEDSERQFIAVEIAPGQEKNLAGALARYFKPDKTVKLRPKWVGDYDIWEMEPEEEDKPDAKKKKKAPAVTVVGAGAPVAIPPPVPVVREHEAVCVAEGYFFYASHMSGMRDMLQFMVKKKAAPKRVLSLEKDLDYQNVTAQLDAQQKLRNWPAVCARRFDRSDEGTLINYELTRTGELKKSSRDSAKFLLDLLDPGGDGSKPFDMSKLPPHAAIRRYLHASGTLVRAEIGGECADMKDMANWCGWFVVNFTLQK